MTACEPMLGRIVIPRSNTHPRAEDGGGEVIYVHPSGTAGIIDPDGVLHIRMATGAVIFAAAGEWREA